jgi:hypothetical protein
MVCVSCSRSRWLDVTDTIPLLISRDKDMAPTLSTVSAAGLGGRKLKEEVVSTAWERRMEWEGEC